MNLGAFSVSLAVKDIEASRKFYEKFGFKVFAGQLSQNWLVLKNGDHAVGLFQGMFEKNILTFNPGWDSNAQKLDVFTDVRDLQRQLKAKGVAFENRSGSNVDGTCELYGRRSRRQSDSGRSARVSAHAKPRVAHTARSYWQRINRVGAAAVGIRSD
jgi:lactoylglutathione lyase